MLRNKFKILVVLLLIMTIIAIAGTSLAADYTCKVSLLGNKTEVKRGESVTILVKATDIQAGDGIKSFNAKLEYDSNVFDCAVSDGDEGNWQREGLVENSISMTRSDSIANAEDQTIAKIVLTAKSDAALGEQTFKLTQLEFSTGEETFSVSDVSATISIIDDSESDNNTNSIINTNSSNNSDNNSRTNTNARNTLTIANVSPADNSIPKTGITDVLIIAAIIAVIAAVIFYVKYKKTY